MLHRSASVGGLGKNETMGMHPADAGTVTTAKAADEEFEAVLADLLSVPPGCLLASFDFKKPCLRLDTFMNELHEPLCAWESKVKAVELALLDLPHPPVSKRKETLLFLRGTWLTQGLALVKLAWMEYNLKYQREVCLHSLWTFTVKSAFAKVSADHLMELLQKQHTVVMCMFHYCKSVTQPLMPATCTYAVHIAELCDSLEVQDVCAEMLSRRGHDGAVVTNLAETRNVLEAVIALQKAWHERHRLDCIGMSLDDGFLGAARSGCMQHKLIPVFPDPHEPADPAAGSDTSGCMPGPHPSSLSWRERRRADCMARRLFTVFPEPHEPAVPATGPDTMHSHFLQTQLTAINARLYDAQRYVGQAKRKLEWLIKTFVHQYLGKEPLPHKFENLIKDPDPEMLSHCGRSSSGWPSSSGDSATEL